MTALTKREIEALEDILEIYEAQVLLSRRYPEYKNTVSTLFKKLADLKKEN